MASSSDLDSDLIVSVERKKGARVLNNSSNTPQDDDDESSDNNANPPQALTKIMCIVWRNCKMGAAYYSIEEKLLYVFEEMIEMGPEFLLTQNVVREVDPKFVITFGRFCDDFVRSLCEIVVHNQGSDDSTTTTGAESVKSVPPNMFLLRHKDYPFEVCREAVLELSISSLSQISDDPGRDRELHVNTLVNFDHKLSIYAIGALLKYLTKNWSFFSVNKDNLHFLHIIQMPLKDKVLMDWATIQALQIFQKCGHDANFKRGLQASNREGLSVYKIFATNCKSKLGQMCLRNILLNPLNNIETLGKRLNFIAFALQPNNQDFIAGLQDHMKGLIDINVILAKIQNSRANCRDWRVLHRAIYLAMFIGELSTPYVEECSLLQDFHNLITPDLIGLESSICQAIDFEHTRGYGRPVIKPGLDQSLDAKKLRRSDILKHVNAAAEIVMEQLPNFVQQCEIVYLAEMGHLISIREWEPGCNPDDLEHLDFKYMFTLRDKIHYKNPMCVELDANLGDINQDIIAHENRILLRLSGFLLKYNKDIREPIRQLALMDALIAMAKVCAQNNYVRPKLNNHNVHQIEGCRHPILELVSHFEPNSFCSGGDFSHVKIITGPNGSGKSVYLKQVAMCIYFAHIGAYVPAKKANVAMMHSVHSRVQGTESSSVRLSAFMIDVVQASQAMNTAQNNSLVLLDEFGRGTAEDEGFALLIGVVSKFLNMERNCPHVLVSTHLQKISDFIAPSNLVQYFKMSHSHENGVLLYLFRLVEGISNSFAFDIASEMGLDEDTIRRAREFFDNRNATRPLDSCVKYPTLRRVLESDNPDFLVQYLREVNIPDPDPDD